MLAAFAESYALIGAAYSIGKNESRWPRGGGFAVGSDEIRATGYVAGRDCPEIQSSK